MYLLGALWLDELLHQYFLLGLCGQADNTSPFGCSTAVASVNHLVTIIHGCPLSQVHLVLPAHYCAAYHSMRYIIAAAAIPRELLQYHSRQICAIVECCIAAIVPLLPICWKLLEHGSKCCCKTLLYSRRLRANSPICLQPQA